MTNSHSVMLWTPRLAGLGVSLFLATFALDAFGAGSIAAALPAFALHLVPATMVLAAVAAAWHRPLTGVVTFPALALVYATMVRWRLDWVAVIGGPLVLLGVLFYVSWRANERTTRAGSE